MARDLPRSLADDLRSRDDEALAALLQARPDLMNPVPSDVSSLAARATTRASVQRALEQLDLFTLQVVEVLCARPDPMSDADVGSLLGLDPAGPLATLRAHGLVYGERDLVVVRLVREIIGPPAGLGPPAEELLRSYGPARLEQLATDLHVATTAEPAGTAAAIAGLFADPTRLGALLDGAPAESRDAMAALTWGPPAGRVENAHRAVDAARASSPVDWLLARGLLVAAGEDTVVLPREVALHLRGGRVHRSASPHPPDLEVAERDTAVVDRTAAGAVLGVVRLVEELLELWSADPPRVLRAGGLGVRDRARTASALDVDETLLALLAETAQGAGLLAATEEPVEAWLPTPAYDGWLAADAADRWLPLALTWLDSTRVAGLAGRRDERDRVLAPLGPGLDRVSAPQVRRSVLDLLASAGPGAAPTPSSVVDRLRWHAPRRLGRLRDDLVGWTLREAETLGLTGRGALAAHGRNLVEGRPEVAREQVAGALPRPLDHILLQADLTAIAPGPLTGDLAAGLRAMAEVESTGGATVYRFGDRSVRRALDAGWSKAEVLELLGRHSSTPVPQPLTYLVEDVARRHGRVRVGAASSYVRCDDETTLGEIAADRRADGLRLRRLAPTVLAAGAPAELVLERLRELGYTPAAEGAKGEVVVRRPELRRSRHARQPPAQHRLSGPTAPAPALVAAAVRAVRAGDRAMVAAIDRGGPQGAGPARRPTADVLAMLAQAAAERGALWIGYVSAEGHASHRVIEPIALDGGYVSAFDHLRDEVRTFAVHRITGVSEVAAGDG